MTHHCAIEEKIIDINSDCVHYQACGLSHNIHSISHSLLMLDDIFELTWKRSLSNDSLKFIN